MKRAAAAAAALVSLLALTACSGQEPPSPEGGVDTDHGDFTEYEYDLADDRTVTCIVVNVYRGVGLSCDWGNAE